MAELHSSSFETDVLIIGAGFSGICTAIELKRKLHLDNFIIVEKSASVGGTWNDNRYPGCCCDVWYEKVMDYKLITKVPSLFIFI